MARGAAVNKTFACHTGSPGSDAKEKERERETGQEKVWEKENRRDGEGGGDIGEEER